MEVFVSEVEGLPRGAGRVIDHRSRRDWCVFYEPVPVQSGTKHYLKYQPYANEIRSYKIVLRFSVQRRTTAHSLFYGFPKDDIILNALKSGCNEFRHHSHVKTLHQKT